VTPRVVVPYGMGSASPLDIVMASDGLADVVFLVPRQDDEAIGVLPVLEQLARAVLVDDLSAGTATNALAAAGIVPAGAVTFVDTLLPLTAALTEGAGLPGISSQAAVLCTNKSLQRQKLNAAGAPPVSTSPFRPQELENSPAVFPAVLKPEAGAASVNTFIVRSLDELEKLRPQLPAGNYVLEELLVGSGHPGAPWLGDYCSVETLVLAGQQHHLGVCDRTPLAEPARETGMVFPSALPPAQAEAVVALASQAISALGIDTGFVHTEVKHTAKGPSVIEVNGRLGGQVHQLMRRTGVCNPVRLAVQACLGQASAPRLGEPDGVVAHLWVLPPRGATKLVSLPSVPELRQQPGVIFVSVVTRPGGAVDWRRGTLSAHLLLMLKATSHGELGKMYGDLQEFLDARTEWE